MALWAEADRREEERQDEKNFLMGALEPLADAVESAVRPLRHRAPVSALAAAFTAA
jgi:hypothetical protein